MEKLEGPSELVGVTETATSFGQNDSSPRVHMDFSQHAQACKINNPNLPRLLHSFEEQLAETSNVIRMPCDAVVINVISKHNAGGLGKHILDKTVVYQDIDTGLYNTLHLSNYYSGHDTFCSRRVLTAEGRRLRPGANIEKDTILAEIEGTIQGGLYTTSRTLNYCNISLAGTIEDGFIVNEDCIDDLRPTAKAKREAAAGRKAYFVNTHGDQDNFIPFKRTGEKIRKDNILFATRKNDEILDSVYMLADMIDKIDYVYDDCVYAPANANEGIVTSLKVTHNAASGRRPFTPTKMREVLSSYTTDQRTYAEELLKTYRKLMREEGGNLNIGGEMELELTHCLADVPSERPRRGKATGNIGITKKQTRLEEWHVEMEVSWLYKLSYGSKISDRHGGKGVICAIWPKEWMPTDDFGNVADICQFVAGPFARMCLGQEYERYYEAIHRDTSKDIREMVEDGRIDEAIEHGLTVQKLMYPPYGEYKEKIVRSSPQEAQRYIDSIVDDELRTVVPSAAGRGTPEVAVALGKYRRPDKSCITYRNFNGQMERSNEPIAIWPKTIIILDKSSWKPFASNTAPLQQQGVLATANKTNKVSNPTTQNPPRSWAEAEVRNLCHSIGGRAVSYQIDMSTNPHATRHVLLSMCKAAKPFKKVKHIDRKVIPEGGSRTLMFVKAIFFCLGIDIVKRKKGDLDDGH